MSVGAKQALRSLLAQGTQTADKLAFFAKIVVANSAP
jgi:hypothetical protein